MSKKKTTEQFIIESKEIYGDKFDYSLTEYINCFTKIKIICPIHGIIGKNHEGQTPSLHYRGGGCFHCSRAKEGLSKASNLDEFITKARMIHGDKFDYSETTYINKRTFVKIKCKEHGNYLGKGDKGVLPGSHLQGHGCIICQGENTTKTQSKTTEQFIKESIDKHGDKFDYSLTEYHTARKPIVVICPEHGEISWDTPMSHISSPSGCQLCSFSEFYVGYNEKTHFYPFLRSICNYKIIPQYFIRKNKTRYCIDCYIPELKIAIEYDENHHKYQKTEDKERQEFIETQLNCKFIRISDKEFMKDHDYAKNMLKEAFSINNKVNVDELFE